MKKIIKITLIICLIIFLVIEIYNIFIILMEKNKSLAATSSNTSDVQLIARAINGEARGEPYEGQVAVRSSYFK